MHLYTEHLCFDTCYHSTIKKPFGQPCYPPVHTPGVAAYLGVSKPSVSVALKRLCDKGYIIYDYNMNINLVKNIDEESLLKDEAPTIESELSVQLSDSEKKYIWAIEQLKTKNGFVRSVDIASILGVSKPSVSIALKKLRDKGVVFQQPNGSLAIVTSCDNAISQSKAEVLADIDVAEEFQIREAEEQARREAEEQARRKAEEQARREAEETRRRAMEAQKAAEKARISAEILDLTNELNSLKGLFVGKKRKKLQIHIDELNELLRGL